MSDEFEQPKIKIGISSCLLGNKVRFNGDHKLDTHLTYMLSKYFEYYPVCPEVEMGMPVPREIIRLTGNPEEPGLLAPKSNTDYTVQMKTYTKNRVEELAKLHLHGFILKKDSPSCGMERVKVWNDKGIPVKQGKGIFAAGLIERFPELPVEEEGRLRDAILKENFIERVFTFYRLQKLVISKPKRKHIIKFHTQLKLSIMSHSQKHYQILGKMVAKVAEYDQNTFLLEYSKTLMEALKVKAGIKKHTNVLYHILGYFKKHLNEPDKTEMIDHIEAYRAGLVPLIVPITLLKHHLRHYPEEWLQSQNYLNPYPLELKLRNSI